MITINELLKNSKDEVFKMLIDKTFGEIVFFQDKEEVEWFIEEHKKTEVGMKFINTKTLINYGVLECSNRKEIDFICFFHTDDYFFALRCIIPITDIVVVCKYYSVCVYVLSQHFNLHNDSRKNIFRNIIIVCLDYLHRIGKNVVIQSQSTDLGDIEDLIVI